MLEKWFHGWERRLLAVTENRVVRPFEWGVEWVSPNGHGPRDTPLQQLERWSADAVADSDAFYATDPAPRYELDPDGWLTFLSALPTRYPANDTVHCRYFPARDGGARRAVLVLPQWNADPEGHVGLCRVLSRFGMSALRLSLPYHDRRMPPELRRADYIVSANLGRTLHANRQAVLDARRAIAWLASRGYERIGILGTSLGSCLSLLTMAHEPLVRVAAFNHVSTYFADVVWRGISTAHVRQSLEGHVDLETLRRVWLPISPYPFLDRIRGRQALLVYARYDLTFPVDLSRHFVHEFGRRAIPHRVAVLPCGHYSTGKAPFKFLDGYVLTRFLAKNL